MINNMNRKLRDIEIKLATIDNKLEKMAIRPIIDKKTRLVREERINELINKRKALSRQKIMIKRCIK